MAEGSATCEGGAVPRRTRPAAGRDAPPADASNIEHDPVPDLQHGADSGATCPVCRGPAVSRCAGCRAVSYCGSDHQRRHWSAHGAACRPYTTGFHHRLGRHLVATRDIKRGELILRDRPLMVGPCQLTAPLCLGCYRPLPPLSTVPRCGRCGWPLCSPACEESAQHQPECDVTARSPLGALSSPAGADWYEVVSVMRLLELRETDAAAWVTLLDLQSHDLERRDTEAYRLEHHTVVERIRTRFGQSQHSELLIHRICGIMNTNAYEIRLPEINVQGVYPEAALFEHNCVPNTHRTFDEDLTLVVRAAVDIDKGEHLTSIYTDSLWGTWQRREHLLDSKHFLCGCARCTDPTELGTGLSSLRCIHCRCGYIAPTDPLREQTDYTCDTCGAHVDAAPVRATIAELTAEVTRLEEDPTIAACERLVAAYSKVLHPHHHLMLDLYYPLVHLYNSSEPLSARQLDRKQHLCRQLLSVADVLTPGISRLRGIVLYELQQALLQVARKLWKKKRRKMNDDLIRQFQEARQALSGAVSVLRWEPRVQPEGQLGLEAAEELAQLDAWLEKHVTRAVPAEGGPHRSDAGNAPARDDSPPRSSSRHTEPADGAASAGVPTAGLVSGDSDSAADTVRGLSVIGGAVSAGLASVVPGVE